MVRTIIIGAFIILIVHLIESFLTNKKVVKVDPTKLKRLKAIYSSEDSAMLISKAIRHTTELEQWRNERAHRKKLEELENSFSSEDASEESSKT